MPKEKNSSLKTTGNLKNQMDIRNQHPYYIWESIMKIPDLLEDCLGDEVLNQVHKVAENIKKKKINKIFLVGTAAGQFAAIAEKFAFEKISQIPTYTYLTPEFFAYPPAEHDRYSAVFFHSHSGGTRGDPETVQMVKDHQGYTVAVTDIKESTLAKCVDDVMIGPGGSKKEMPATRTYSSAVFRMLSLAIELGKGKITGQELDTYEEQLRDLPRLLAKVTKKYAEEASGYAAMLKECKSFFMIGSGPNYATASEVAIGIGQSLGVAAQSYQVDNFLNGPIQYLRKSMGVILIAPSGLFQDRILKAASASRAIGAKTVVLAPQNQTLPEKYDVEIRIPAEVPEIFSPVVYITPLWQIAYHLALLGRGGHPDRLSMDRPEFIQAFSIIKK